MYDFERLGLNQFRVFKRGFHYITVAYAPDVQQAQLVVDALNRMAARP